jgi:hypothetical protein
MAHSLPAIIASSQSLKEIADRFQHAHLVPLTDDFAMIPATRNLLDELEIELADAIDTSSRAPSSEEFSYLTHSLHGLLCELSRRTPAAYIETNYFGGDGSQSGAAYVDGSQIASLSDRKTPSDRDDNSSWPINRALSHLGIRTTIFGDAFDKLGLGRFRSIDDALRAAEK